MGGNGVRSTKHKNFISDTLKKKNKKTKPKQTIKIVAQFYRHEMVKKYINTM